MGKEPQRQWTVLQHYTQEWGGWWQAKPGGAEVSQYVRPDEAEVPPFEGEAIRRALASFKSRTSCKCGLLPMHLGMLSDDLLKVIASQ